MVCVPGGALLLGDPHAFPTTGDKSPLPERLVQLRPFALDADEVTVGSVRQLLSAGAVPGAPMPRSSDRQLPEGACTYLGQTDASNDALPINCVSHAFATSVCEALGKRLPTEAEWEWAAGNLDAESIHPWGNDSDVCGHAVVGLGRFAEAYDPEPIGCREKADGSFLPWGPVVSGHPLDVNVLGIRNLAGNMAEWVADQLASYRAPCWSGGTPQLVDPRCDEEGPRSSIRGSSWAGFELSARAAARDGSSGGSNAVGFRCALAMTP
jgi:formylglycine-generating enzyme required for sulfatase activity